MALSRAHTPVKDVDPANHKNYSTDFQKIR